MTKKTQNNPSTQKAAPTPSAKVTSPERAAAYRETMKYCGEPTWGKKCVKTSNRPAGPHCCAA